jgi:hypothetical protein
MNMQAENGEASYRQDDAPPGADIVVERPQPSGGMRAAAPSRSVDEILAVLRSTPEELGRMIEGKSEEVLAQPASDGEWGVVEILPHLRDWEEVYLGWIHRILEEEIPELAVVDDSLWAIEHAYASERVSDALASFSDTRDEVARLLETLAAEAWRREAVHPQVGRISLHQLADRMCDHDARHIEQARDALA